MKSTTKIHIVGSQLEWLDLWKYRRIISVSTQKKNNSVVWLFEQCPRKTEVTNFFLVERGGAGGDVGGGRGGAISKIHATRCLRTPLHWHTHTHTNFMVLPDGGHNRSPFTRSNCPRNRKLTSLKSVGVSSIRVIGHLMTLFVFLLCLKPIYQYNHLAKDSEIFFFM